MKSDEREAAPPANVLVVDDVEQNLLSLQALLAPLGLRVLSARSGAQALELLLQNEVALALLDVQMPEMDGYTLAELMRGTSRTREVPVIFVTAAAADPARAFRGYAAGAVDFLYKPIDPRMLVSKVQVFVELFQRRQQLHERNVELERLLALNETMAAVLTHDLRTPLSAIAMSAAALDMHVTDERFRGAVRRIVDSGRRMSRMIAQLLDFSRLRSGVFAIEPRAADLREVCEAAAAELRGARPGTGIEINAEGSLAGSFDADRMGQVFANLLGNAVQHGAAGQPVRVRLSGLDADRLSVEVGNAGQLSEPMSRELFSAFSTAREQRGEGLGLGLFIVAQFVRAHGGEVSGGNRDGRVVFEFWIPRAGALTPALSRERERERE